MGEMMRKLNSTYARYHARTRSRHGYLFQDRYKSIATQDQNYIEEIVRYIHLNPVRAGICAGLAQLDRYPWCGHAAIMGNARNNFQDTKTVLRRFGKTDAEARERYRQYLEEGTASSSDTVIRTIRDSNRGRESVFHTGCWVIGDKEFVQKVLASDKEKRIRLATYKREHVDLDGIAEKVASAAGVQVTDILTRSRLTKGAAARQAFAYLCRKELGYPVVEIGRYLGISGPAASICIKNGREAVRKLHLENAIKLS